MGKKSAGLDEPGMKSRPIEDHIRDKIETHPGQSFRNGGISFLNLIMEPERIQRKITSNQVY